MDRFEYYLARFLFFLFQSIPYTLVKYVALGIAWLTQYVIRYRTDLVRSNIKRAFPEFTDKEVRTTVRDTYNNFSFLWIEWLQSRRFDKDFALKNVEVYNWQVVEDAIKENKGVVLYSGHLGNFEWVARYVQHFHGQVTGIMRRMHNKYINDFAVALRKNLGFGVIYTDGAFEKSVDLLQKGGLLGVAGDQDAHEKGVFVDFFGVPSSTPVGAALFHLRTGTPVVFVAGMREKWGKFKFYFERVPVPENKEVNDENIYRIIQAASSILEKYVRKYPGQYFWTHRRWKTVPNEAQMAEFEERRRKFMDRSLLEDQ
jgi:KDO2-lipid IV(A) lauroyltransferase